MSIEYDIGTGRAWNNTWTEKITMLVNGKKPDMYRRYLNADYIDHELIIYNKVEKRNLPGFHTYLWQWENETIQEDNVFISYDLIPSHYPREYPSFFPQMITGIGITAVLVVGTFAIVERAKRKED